MMKKVTLLCSRLDTPGGIERAVVNTANLFYEHGHEVTIFIADVTAKSFYPINPGVAVKQLSLHFGITREGNVFTRKLAFFRHIHLLKKAFQQIKPDILIGTEYSLTIAGYYAAKHLSTKLYAWEHHHFHWLKKNRFWTILFRYVYPRLQAVVCNNSTEKSLFDAIGCKVVVIPYVIPETEARTSALQRKNILSIGWLIKRKGVDLVPAIANKVRQKHPDWKWKIIGTGAEYENLQQQILDYQLSDFLQIVPPQSHELAEEYLQASIFVMTSRFECLPLVLLEANRFGLPCVAFDCPTGPADIITNSVNGYLVPLEDVQAMAQKINELIADKEKSQSMGKAAYKHSQRYLPEKIYADWRQLFHKMEKKNNPSG